MSKLTISVSPHIYSPVDTKYMMKSVIVALIPTIIASVIFFRAQAVGLMSASVAGCVITEYLLQKMRKRRVAIGDYSSVVTGLLLALVLPPGLPIWVAFFGGVVAVALGKEVFGGLGCNIFNPALFSRAFLMATFPVMLTTWHNPMTLDAVTTATPLGLAKFDNVITSYASLFVGKVSGSLGETSALALIIGAAYLLHKKIIDYRIPVAYIGTVAAFATLTHVISPSVYEPASFHILAGGLLLGAFFMATDPVTSPVTASGRWIFGIGCGIITMIVRLWGGLPEGVMYSILLMNALTPLITRATRPRRFGVTNVPRKA